MNALKKYWHVILLTLVTAGLGVIIFLTTQKLQQTEPVAPTVPQATPEAAAPACTLTFSIGQETTGTPTPTPTATPTPGATSTPTPTSSAENTPTPTQSVFASPTPTSGTAAFAPTATPSPLPTPNVPVAGTGPSILGAAVVAGGFLLLLLGLVF
jgi:hypothetical protein